MVVRIHQADGIVRLCVWRFYVLYTDSTKGRRFWGKICARTRRYSNSLITVDVFRGVYCFDVSTLKNRSVIILKKKVILFYFSFFIGGVA